MKRLGIVALIVGVALVLAGCGGQASEAPSDTTPKERTATNEESSFSRPPNSSLAYGGQAVTGELGSYCWSSAGSPATCADAAGIPVAPEQQRLTVPTGSMLIFDYGGKRRPDSIEARAYPLEQNKRWVRGAEGARLMRPKGGRSVLETEDLRARREGDRTAIPAELNSGEYVVEILVRAPRGDASYYFRVTLEGDA
jgi:hypothetical protein